MALSKYNRGFVYMCLGCLAEVSFTSLKNFPILEGKTQLWVFPLYYFGSIYGFEILYKYIKNKSIILRAFIYGIMILFIEYIAGYLIKKIIGKCPWEYTNNFNVSGLINLSYLLLWSLVGLAAEYVNSYLNSIILKH